MYLCFLNSGKSGCRTAPSPKNPPKSPLQCQSPSWSSFGRQPLSEGLKRLNRIVVVEGEEARIYISIRERKITRQFGHLFTWSETPGFESSFFFIFLFQCVRWLFRFAFLSIAEITSGHKLPSSVFFSLSQE